MHVSAMGAGRGAGMGPGRPGAVTRRNFLRGRGQLQFSDNRGRQRIYISSSTSPETVCATNQMLKQCHQQKVEKCNRAVAAHAKLSKLNHVRTSRHTMYQWEGNSGPARPTRRQYVHYVEGTYYAPITVKPHYPPPGLRWA